MSVECLLIARLVAAVSLYKIWPTPRALHVKSPSHIWMITWTKKAHNFQIAKVKPQRAI